MNAMTSNARAATPQEAEQLADLIYAPKEQVDEIAAANRDEARRIVRRDFWQRTGYRVVIGGLLVVSGLQAAFIVVRPPQERISLHTVYQRDDGSVTGYRDWSELPDKAKEVTTINDVVRYVLERESWWGEAPARWTWTAISAMSDQHVQEAFQGWFNGPGPSSPAQQYKDGTGVEARYVNWEYACPDCAQQDQNAYRVWFDRYEWPRGASAGILKGRYSVTVTIRRNVPIPPDRMWQKWTFNGSESQVIGYSQPRREGTPR